MSHVKKVVFFDSYFFQKGFNSWSRFFFFENGFNSLGHIFCFKKKSILWVILKKGQFCDSYFKEKETIFETYSKRVQSFWFIFNSMSLFFFAKEGFNSLNHIEKKVQFLESFFKKFNSVSHILKGSILGVIFCKRDQFILWVIFLFVQKKKKRFNSLSHIFSRVQFLWVMLKRRVQFCESYLKMVQFLESYFRKVQFFESSEKRLNS